MEITCPPVLPRTASLVNSRAKGSVEKCFQKVNDFLVFLRSQLQKIDGSPVDRVQQKFAII